MIAHFTTSPKPLELLHISNAQTGIGKLIWKPPYDDRTRFGSRERLSTKSHLRNRTQDLKNDPHFFGGSRGGLNPGGKNLTNLESRLASLRFS